MPHKTADPALIKNLENQISYADQSIARVRSFSKGGPDGLKQLIEMIRDVRDRAVFEKDGHVEKGSPIQAAASRAEERAYNFIIDMVENPSKRIKYFKERREQIERELRELRKYASA